ncbi:MAG: STAS domain-containing protein [Gemmataceae bacterium]
MELINQVPGAVVVSLPPRPCHQNQEMEVFKQKLIQASVRSGKVILDCRDVEVVPAGFLSALVGTRNRLGAKAGDIVLCNVPSSVAMILEVTGLDEFFPIRRTLLDAIRMDKPRRLEDPRFSVTRN